jgi:hypothetical protein
MKKVPIFAWAILMVLQIALPSCQTEDTPPEPVDPRLNFLGIWSVNENWTKLTYEVSITNDPGSSDGVYIENFAGSGSGITTHALISGNNITISPLPQTISTDWKILNGSGALQGTTIINWTYKFTESANTYYATAVYTKK